MTPELPSQVNTLLALWRGEATQLRRRGQESLALLIESLALELDNAWGAHLSELLTLQEAATASGYSVDHLARLIRKRGLPNAGGIGRPRIRRSDLPRRIAGPATKGYDPDADARTLLNLREDE